MVHDFGYYDYGFNGAEAAAGVAGFFSVFLILYYLIIMAVGIASYVMQSLSLYTIAKRRGIHHPWLAWIPVGSAWLLGSISDQYQAIAKKKPRCRRKVLLGLNLGMLAVSFVMVITIAASAITEAAAMDASEMLFGASIAVFLLMMLATLVLTFVTAIFMYIAYYDLYASCDPNDAALFLVLSILFSISMPVLLMISRKKDLGMPPRRRPEPAAAYIPVAESTPVEEPVEEVPVEDAHVEVVPAVAVPVEDTPADEAPTAETQPE